MFYPVYRLAIDAQRRMRLGPVVGRALRTTVVVPREACAFEQVSSTGVAWHERAGFARLQLMRLAPFTATGGCAAMRQRTLMLWMWDAQEVDAALSAGGVDPARVRQIGETLMLPVPQTTGGLALRSQDGTDHLVLDRGAIKSSRWEADPSIGRAAPDLLRSPWARDLLNAAGMLGAWDAQTLQRTLTMTCWTAAFAGAAYFAYWGGQWQGLEARVAAQAAESDQSSTDFGRLLQLKQTQSADQAWLSSYRRLSSSIRIDALLDRLRQPMEANNLTMKELELRNEDLRFVVASAGGEIDLPRVLEALTAVPGLDSVQLRQSPDTQQASFTMRVTGFQDNDPAAGKGR